MNRTDIVQKIENPNLCTATDVTNLENLIEKYPYAQTFPILLLKTLGRTKDIHFEDALNKHAFRISDRMHLYYVINEAAEPDFENESIEKQNEEPQIDRVERVISIDEPKEIEGPVLQEFGWIMRNY
jgi:hypothetical protein